MRERRGGGREGRMRERMGRGGGEDKGEEGRMRGE